jgi:hypothetical protein
MPKVLASHIRPPFELLLCRVFAPSLDPLRTVTALPTRNQRVIMGKTIDIS